MWTLCFTFRGNPHDACKWRHNVQTTGVYFNHRITHWNQKVCTITDLWTLSFWTRLLTGYCFAWMSERVILVQCKAFGRPTDCGWWTLCIQSHERSEKRNMARYVRITHWSHSPNWRYSYGTPFSWAGVDNARKWYHRRRSKKGKLICDLCGLAIARSAPMRTCA